MVAEELRAGMDNSGGGVATSRSNAAHSSSSTVFIGAVAGMCAEGGGMGWDGMTVLGRVGVCAVLKFSAGNLAASAWGFVSSALDSTVSSKKPPCTWTTGFVLFLELSSSLLAFRFLLPLLTSRAAAGSDGLEVLNRSLSARIACCNDLRCLLQTSVSDLSGIWHTVHSNVPVAE